jgi:hypothetical protein
MKHELNLLLNDIALKTIGYPFIVSNFHYHQNRHRHCHCYYHYYKQIQGCQ